MTPQAEGSYFEPKHLEQVIISYLHFTENGPSQAKATQHDPDKIHDFEIHDEYIDMEPYGKLAPGQVGQWEIAWGTSRWDIIAQSMWESYQLELQMCGL